MKQQVGYAHKKPVDGVVFDTTGRYMVSWALFDGAIWWDLETKTAKALKEGVWFYIYQDGLFVDTAKRVAYRAETGEPAALPPGEKLVWNKQTGEPFSLRVWGGSREVFRSELIAGKDDDIYTHPTEGWGLVQQGSLRGCTFLRLERDKKPVKIGSTKRGFALYFGVRWLPGTSLIFCPMRGFLLDAKTGRVLLNDERYKGDECALSADGKTLFVADRFELRSFSLPDGKPGKTISVNRDFPAPYTSGWTIWPSPVEGVCAVSPYVPGDGLELRKLYAYRPERPMALVSEGAFSAALDTTLEKLREAAARKQSADAATLARLAGTAATSWRRFVGANKSFETAVEKGRLAFVAESDAIPWLEVAQPSEKMMFVIHSLASGSGGPEPDLQAEFEENLSKMGKPNEWRKVFKDALRVEEYDKGGSGLPSGARMWTWEVQIKGGKSAFGDKVRFRLRVTRPNAYLVVHYSQL
jgi:hypothetical protein